MRRKENNRRKKDDNKSANHSLGGVKKNKKSKRKRSKGEEMEKEDEEELRDVRPTKKGRNKVNRKSVQSSTSSNVRSSSSSSLYKKSSLKKPLSLKKPTQKMISPFVQHVMASQGASRETLCICRGKSIAIDLLAIEGYDELRQILINHFLKKEEKEDFDDLDIAYLDEKKKCRWLSDGAKGSSKQSKSGISDMKEVDWFKFCSTVRKVFVYLRKGPVY